MAIFSGKIIEAYYANPDNNTVEVIYREGFDGHEMDFDKFVKHQSEKKFTIGKNFISLRMN